MLCVDQARARALGLELVDTLAASGVLKNYHLLPSVRGVLRAKLKRFDEACGEFKHAAALTRNARERELLLERANNCHSEGSPRKR